jgi:hypothetical protein
MDMQTIRRVGALHARVPTASGRPLRGQDLVDRGEADGVLNGVCVSSATQRTRTPFGRAMAPLPSCHAPPSIENNVKNSPDSFYIPDR